MILANAALSLAYFVLLVLWLWHDWQEDQSNWKRRRTWKERQQKRS